jgi:hypothetical protein
MTHTTLHENLQHAIAALEAHADQQGIAKMDGKIRVGLDIGIIVFIITLSFNAGIQYSKIGALEEKAKDNTAQIEILRAQGNQTSAVLGSIQQSLIDIRQDVQRNKP